MPESISGHRLPVYHDKKIRLIGIPVITAFGYYLTYNNIKLNGWFFYEILSDAFKIFLIWQVVRWCIIRLDLLLPWRQHFTTRLLFQIMITTIGGIATLAALVYLDYTFIRPYQLEHFWSFDIVIALIFLLFVNGIYTGLYFYDSYLVSVSEKLEAERKLNAEATSLREHLVVNVGRKDILVPYPEITCIFSEGKETYLLTSNSKTYLLNSSLDRLEEQLPPSLFFRANRKFILTPNLVQSFTSETHGKLTVQLKPNSKFLEPLSISRDKAPAFRRWLNP